MKDLQIPGDGSVIENRTFMESNADEILPDYEYTRNLTDEEIENERIEFANVSIKIEQLQEEKARVMAELNEKIKAQTTLAKKALGYIRRGRMDVIATVFLVKDENEGMIGTYDMNGVLLTERKMRGTERQKTVFTRDRVDYKDERDGTNG